jgi:type I restriction enzyme S subunit
MVCSKGIRINQWDLDPDQYRTLSVVLPPLDEQGKVAAFLDHETAKIDALVAEQEQLIALLKEKRQAVISHAVTKGLNPDAPMKDSGIEWIGAIPATWRTSRLKFEISMLVDCPHETPTYSVDGEFSVVRTADVADGALLCEGMLRIAANDYEHRIRRSALEQDDIVYGREGERWGHAALIPAANQFCLGQRMIQLRANTSSLLPEFLMWQLSSTSVYRQGALDTVGSTSPHVNISTIRNFWIAVPPIDVQRRLIDELRTKIAEVRTLIAEAERGIELLQERRTALISAAVTGQIDVRGWADRSVA